MMRILCQVPAYIEADNLSKVVITSIPDSTLKKNSRSIVYHMVREGAARDEWRNTYVSTYDN